MGLADKDLTAGQIKIMQPLVANVQIAQERLKSAQANYNDAIDRMEEYIRQSAEKLSIDPDKDYVLDLAMLKFKDRASVADTVTAAQPLVP